MQSVKWSTEMDQFIKAYYTKIGPVAAAKRLDVTTAAVSERALWLGATKRQDSLELKDFDCYDLKYQTLKQDIQVGNKLSFPVERVIKGKVKKCFQLKKVVAIYPSYIVLDNGKYKEAVMFKDLVELVKTS
nr:hypothetical protein [uncultured Cellulosilyticum sp.]